MICADCGHEIQPEKRVDVKEFENLCYDCHKLKFGGGVHLVSPF